MEDYPGIHWNFSYNKNTIIIKVTSLKYSDIKYIEEYISEVGYPYSETDKKQMFEIRDKLVKKAFEDQQNKSTAIFGHNDIKTLTKPEMWKVLNGKTVKCIYTSDGDYNMFAVQDLDSLNVYMLDEYISR